MTKKRKTTTQKEPTSTKDIKQKPIKKEPLRRISPSLVLEDDYIEPNTGKRCLVTLNKMGIRCAYAQAKSPKILSLVSDERVCSSLTYKPMNPKKVHGSIWAHGGITFTGFRKDIVDENVPFIGIDFGHWNDIRDSETARQYFDYENSIYNAFFNNSSYSEFAELRDVDSVKEEINSVAEQLNKIEQAFDKDCKRVHKKSWIYGKNNWKHR